MAHKLCPAMQKIAGKGVIYLAHINSKLESHSLV